jgi:hypothetical protein
MEEECFKIEERNTVNTNTTTLIQTFFSLLVQYRKKKKTDFLEDHYKCVESNSTIQKHERYIAFFFPLCLSSEKLLLEIQIEIWLILCNTA